MTHRLISRRRTLGSTPSAASAPSAPSGPAAPQSANGSRSARSGRALAMLVAGGLAAGGLAGCSNSTDPSTPSSAASSSATDSSTSANAVSPVPASPSASPSISATDSCVDATFAALTPAQRRGQLVMVALQAGAPSASLIPYTADHHVGNVIYLGGWNSGTADITATSRLLQGQATQSATGGVQMLIAADQEGGEVQQFKAGFTRIPSALTQSSWAPAEITRQATAWGTELKNVGVNLDLAPVTDTVPTELGRGNGPIGQWDRQYGFDPSAVSRGATAFIAGMTAAGVQTSVKHFPGIGRIQGNTDYTTAGLVDTVMTPEDPYLQPFVDGWTAGAGLVMLGSATYPNLDPDNPAMFSPAIVTDLLRTKLGFTGVTITDDINAASVKAVPVADRATRFVDAGGDILLTGDTPSAPALLEALTTKAAAEPAFAAKVDAAVKRVLTLKASMGLIPGCTAG